MSELLLARQFEGYGDLRLNFSQDSNSTGLSLPEYTQEIMTHLPDDIRPTRQWTVETAVLQSVPVLGDALEEYQSFRRAPLRRACEFSEEVGGRVNAAVLYDDRHLNLVSAEAFFKAWWSSNPDEEEGILSARFAGNFIKTFHNYVASLRQDGAKVLDNDYVQTRLTYFAVATENLKNGEEALSPVIERRTQELEEQRQASLSQVQRCEVEQNVLGITLQTAQEAINISNRVIEWCEA